MYVTLAILLGILLLNVGYQAGYKQGCIEGSYKVYLEGSRKGAMDKRYVEGEGLKYSFKERKSLFTREYLRSVN